MEVWRKRNVAANIFFPLIDRGTLDFENTPVTFVAGDTQFSVNGAAFANTALLPVHEGNGIYSLSLISGEINGNTTVITIIDSATKLWEDQAIIITTYGDAPARHAVDLDDAVAMGLSRLDADISSRAAPGAAMTLTAGERASIVNEVWDELISDARTALSYGQRLKDAIGLDTLTAARVGNLDNPDVLTSSRAVAGDAMALTAAAVDAVWDEDIVAAHGGASAAGLLLRVLGAAVSTRANNATLDALLGVVDAVGRDLPEQVWLEVVRVLTANTNLNDPTAAENADAVWDEAKAGHVAAGSFGEEVQAHALETTLVAQNDVSPAEVNSEVLDVMDVDTFPEPGQGLPPATTTIFTKINHLYKNWRNKKEETATEFRLFNDAGTVVDAKATVSDAAGLTTKEEMASGP